MNAHNTHFENTTCDTVTGSFEFGDVYVEDATFDANITSDGCHGEDGRWEDSVSVEIIAWHFGGARIDRDTLVQAGSEAEVSELERKIAEKMMEAD